jgi:hypothetical protein
MFAAKKILAAAVMGIVAISTTPVCAQQVQISQGSVVTTVRALRAGQFVWEPELAPDGPLLLIVNTKAQRAVVYRNGIPIGASTVSTGRPGYRTPTGVFTILQKHVEHYSTIYDNAPMPYMQRLTWRGVALHAGNLPGYPASHGCIRLPLAFAKLLYGVTRVGMTVVVIDDSDTPRLAALAQGQTPLTRFGGVGEIVWQPARSPSGPVSIIVSAMDKRALVLRNGIEIGSAPVTVEGPVNGTWAYSLRSVGSRAQNWMRIALSAQPGAEQPVTSEEWRRFTAPDAFKQIVAKILVPGSTIIVTSDSLQSDAGRQSSVVMETDPPEEARK